MKNTVYHLGSCSTCVKIIKELNLADKFEMHDIKLTPLSADTLAELKELAGSYESLFSKRAMLYKSRNLKAQNLGEQDFKNLILEHYTFLKRPVTVFNGEVFIGNAPSEVKRLAAAIAK